MRRRIFLLTVLLFFIYPAIAQIQDPDNAIQLSSDFDQAQGRLVFYSDNKDFCDYYLYISFVYSEGFEGMTTGSGASVTVGPGRHQIMTYRVRANTAGQGHSYNYKYLMFRGNFRKKPNIDFVYSLPGTANETITSRIIENQDGYQLTFDLTADTVYACRSGVMCDDNLKDNTAKGRNHFNDNRNLSQITIYHSDGSFGEYIFKGKSLVYPGQKIKMGAPIGIIEGTTRLRFSVYFLDKNKLDDMTIGNKHTHFRPYFQTGKEGKTRLENEKTYTCVNTDEMLMQDMSKHEKKNFLKNKSQK